MTLIHQLTQAKNQLDAIKAIFLAVRVKISHDPLGHDEIDSAVNTQHGNPNVMLDASKIIAGIESLLLMSSSLLDNIGLILDNKAVVVDQGLTDDFCYARRHTRREIVREDGNEKNKINSTMCEVNGCHGEASSVGSLGETAASGGTCSDVGDISRGDTVSNVVAEEGSESRYVLEEVRSRSLVNDVGNCDHFDLSGEDSYDGDTEDYGEEIESVLDKVESSKVYFEDGVKNVGRRGRNSPMKIALQSSKYCRVVLDRQVDELCGSRMSEVRVSSEDTTGAECDGKKELGGDAGSVVVKEGDGGSVDCGFCGKCFAGEAALQCHECRTECGELRRNFVCKLCSSKFGSFSKWFRHQSLSHIDVTCSVCGDSFGGLRGLDLHSRKHDAEFGRKRKFCAICKVSYSIPTELHDKFLHCGNMAATAVEETIPRGEVTKMCKKTYRCTVCDSRYTRKKELIDHKKTHVNIAELSCSLCGRRFATKHCLAKHVKQHAMVKHFPCKHCGKSFKSRMNVNIHQAVHAERTVQCGYCPKKFSSKPRRNRHELSHAAAKSHKCDDCDKSFALASGLRSHKFHMHSDSREMYSCDKCGKTFRSVSGFKEHRRYHDGVKTFVCDECGKRFYDSRSLQSHQRVHTGEKPFRCDVCGTRYAHRTTLRGHQRLHTGIKSSICPVCGKTFLDNSRLAVHLKIHSATKDQHCQICDKYYTNRACLKMHIIRMHGGIKPEPYVCDYCGRRFTQSSHRAAHIRGAHTGERPFPCTECDKAFISNSDLKKHSRTHTGDKPYRCDVCNQSFTHSSTLTKHRLTHRLVPAVS